jgi:hypothetical protein
MPTIDFTSETFAFEAVEAADPDIPYVIWALYDFDGAGQDTCNSLREKVERFAAERGVKVTFTCLAIEESDIDLDSFAPRENMVDVHLQGVGWHRLPTREPKRHAPADKNWRHPFAIKLDAIEPDDLRATVRWAIEQFMPAHQLKVPQAAEESERQIIRHLVDSLTGGEP